MRVTEIIAESKQPKEPPKPRNFVAKNAVNTGAGAHKDKKKAEKQGDFKHKKQAIPMDEEAKRCPQCGSTNCSCEPGKCKCKPVKGWTPKTETLKEEEYDYYRDYKAGLISYQEYQDLVNRDKQREKEQRWAQQEKDRGPWYLKINGKILKTGGEPKVFDWKSGAAKYGRAILRNRPELDGKIFLTKKAEDDVVESATPGATSAANVGTVVSPHLAIGKDRRKKSYTGKPGKSGTKAPKVPKVMQKKNRDGTAKNALDMKTNIFGGGAIKR